MPLQDPIPKSSFTPEILRPYDPRHVPLIPPVPDVLDCPTVAICINASWVSHIDGMIGRLLYRDAWLGDDEEIDRAIEQIRKLLATMKVGNMSCCCDGEQVISRITEDGIYEESADGGNTWTPAPEHDPRKNITLLPPITGGTASDRKCRAANSIIALLKDKLSTDVTRCENNATLGEFAEALIALLVAVGVITTGGAFAVFGAAIWALVAGITCNQFQTAFTETFWQNVACALFCNMSEDGSITDAGVGGSINQIAGDHAPGTTEYAWITKHFQAMGTGGLTNAARLGLSGPYLCDACECPSPCLDETWLIVGNVLQITSDFIDIETEFVTRNGLLAHWFAYGSDDATYCCNFCGWETLSGVVESAVVFNCDGAPHGNSPTPMRRLDGYSLSGVTQVRIHITPSPEIPCT